MEIVWWNDSFHLWYSDRENSYHHFQLQFSFVRSLFICAGFFFVMSCRVERGISSWMDFHHLILRSVYVRPVRCLRTSDKIFIRPISVLIYCNVFLVHGSLSACLFHCVRCGQNFSTFTRWRKEKNNNRERKGMQMSNVTYFFSSSTFRQTFFVCGKFKICFFFLSSFLGKLLPLSTNRRQRRSFPCHHMPMPRSFQRRLTGIYKSLCPRRFNI